MKQRHFTTEFKTRIAREAMAVGNCAVVGRRYTIHASVVRRWVERYKAQGAAGFDLRPPAFPPRWNRG